MFTREPDVPDSHGLVTFLSMKLCVMKLSSCLILSLCCSPVFARDLNVVFILVDDWGVMDAGVQGSDFFETPVIDQFARESVRFTQAYAASPVCSPTRAAIMTGKSPARLDMTIWHEGAVEGGPKNRRMLEATAEPNLPRKEVTIAELFKRENYYTAHIGKWHLGKAAWYPETQGFDLNVGGTYWGAPVSFFYPYRGIWSKSDPELRYVPIGSGKDGDYLTDRLTDHAIDVIREHQDEPFFLSLCFHTVHSPIQGKPKHVRHFRNKAPGRVHGHAEYAAMVASLDENVGRVLQVLEERDLAENTVVILTSDNGGVDIPVRMSGDNPPTSNSPFRSGKGTLYEGGIRVPLIIRWPGRTKAGATCDELVTSQDFFPTLVEGLELDAESSAEQDGVSLLPLLHAPSSELARRTLYWHYPHYYTRMTPGSAIRDGDWKLIHSYEDSQVELFNLATDPSETNDVSAHDRQRADALLAILNQWRASTNANEPVLNSDWREDTDN